MKPKFTFALALVLLASFAAVSQGSGIQPFPVEQQPEPIDSFLKSCADFCAVAYCASGSCGVYTNAKGERDCGCHGGIGAVH